VTQPFLSPMTVGTKSMTTASSSILQQHLPAPPMTEHEETPAPPEDEKYVYRTSMMFKRDKPPVHFNAPAPVSNTFSQRRAVSPVRSSTGTIPQQPVVDTTVTPTPNPVPDTTVTPTPNPVVDRSSMLLVRRTSTSNMQISQSALQYNHGDEEIIEEIIEEYSEELIEVEDQTDDDVDTALMTGGPSFEPAYAMPATRQAQQQQGPAQEGSVDEYYEEEEVATDDDPDDDGDRPPDLQVIVLGAIGPYITSRITIPWKFIFHGNTAKPHDFWKESLHNSTMNALLECFSQTTANRHVMHLLKCLPLYITLDNIHKTNNPPEPNPNDALLSELDEQELQQTSSIDGIDMNPRQQPPQQQQILLEYCESLKDPSALQASAQYFLEEPEDDSLCFVYDGSILHTHPDWQHDNLDPQWVAISPFKVDNKTTTDTANASTSSPPSNNNTDDYPPLSKASPPAVSVPPLLPTPQSAFLHIPGELGDVFMLDILHDVAMHISESGDEADDESGSSYDEMTVCEDEDEIHAVCLDVTEETEYEVTERLQGALHDALDFWEEVVIIKPAFEDPNPWEGISDRPGFDFPKKEKVEAFGRKIKYKTAKPKATISELQDQQEIAVGKDDNAMEESTRTTSPPFGDGLQWAVRAALNYMFPQNYVVPSLLSLEGEFGEEDLDRILDSKPSSITIPTASPLQKNGAEILREYDLETYQDDISQLNEPTSIKGESTITGEEVHSEKPAKDMSYDATPLRSNLTTEEGSEHSSGGPLSPLDANRLDQQLETGASQGGMEKENEEFPEKENDSEKENEKATKDENNISPESDVVVPGFGSAAQEPLEKESEKESELSASVSSNAVEEPESTDTDDERNNVYALLEKIEKGEDPFAVLVDKEQDKTDAMREAAEPEAAEPKGLEPEVDAVQQKEDARDAATQTSDTAENEWRKDISYFDWRHPDAYNEMKAPETIDEDEPGPLPHLQPYTAIAPSSKTKSKKEWWGAKGEYDVDIESQQDSYDATKSAELVAALNATATADAELSPEWQAYIREEERERKRVVNVLRTIRIVLLTLLVVLPFSIGLYFVVEIEGDD